MKEIKLYEVEARNCYQASEEGTGFSLKPWGENTECYKGFDDGGKVYFIPDCYEVKEDENEEKHIYNGKTECELAYMKGTPVIVDYSLSENNFKVFLKKKN